MFSIHFQRCCRGEIALPSRAFSDGDHLPYSRNLNAWFRGDVLRRNWMLVTLTVRRVTKNCIFYRVTLLFNFLRTFSGLSSRIPKPCYQSNLYSRSEGSLGANIAIFLSRLNLFSKANWFVECLVMKENSFAFWWRNENEARKKLVSQLSKLKRKTELDEN